MKMFCKLSLYASMSLLLLVFAACGAEDPDLSETEIGTTSQASTGKAVVKGPIERACDGQTTFSTLQGLTIPDCATQASRDAFCAQQKGCVRSINACYAKKLEPVKLDCCCPGRPSEQ